MHSLWLDFVVRVIQQVVIKGLSLVPGSLLVCYPLLFQQPMVLTMEILCELLVLVHNVPFIRIIDAVEESKSQLLDFANSGLFFEIVYLRSCCLWDWWLLLGRSLIGSR